MYCAQKYFILIDFQPTLFFIRRLRLRQSFRGRAVKSGGELISSASRAASKITLLSHTTTLIRGNYFTMEASSARVLCCLIALTLLFRRLRNNTGSKLPIQSITSFILFLVFFSCRKYVLGLKTDGLAVFGDLGNIRWQLLLCFIFSWLVGKVYKTLTFIYFFYSLTL